MAVRTITVSNATQLTNALSRATGGETILLNTGDYGKLTLSTKSGFNIAYASDVTIRSANPDRPAVFTGLDVSGAANINFEKLVFDYTWKTGDALTISPFGISGSTNMSVSGCTFDGDTAKGGDPAGIGYAAGRGFQANKNTNFDFIDNTVKTFWKGVGIGANDNARVMGNEFVALRSDGLNVVGPKGLLIENNYFHNFERAPNSADHTDFIQFASTGATRPASDITIRGNLFDIGAGGGGTHTIFMRNDQVDRGLAGPEMFFRNVLIEENTIYNDHLHGISVGETAGLVIRNNTVLHANGSSEGPTGTAETPVIGVAVRSTDVTIVNNIVAKVAGGLEGYNGIPATWTVNNNLLVQDDDRTAPNHYSTLFVSTSYNDGGIAGAGGRHYLALPGGVIEVMGVGAHSTLIDRAPGSVTPLFHVGVLPSDDSAFVFDAAHFSFGPAGAAADAAARFLWTFGDGTTDEGGVVAHRYTAPGSYAVKLDVVMPDGSTTTVTDTVQKLGLDLLRFDSRLGDFAVSDGFTDTIVDITPTALAANGRLKAIDLDVLSKASVSAQSLAGLFGADNFAMNLQLKADRTPDSSGNVFRMQNFMSGSVDQGGNFVFTLNTDDGKKTTIASTGVSLLDNRVHDVQILFDADKGFLSIAVDGKPPVSAVVTGDLPPMGPWGLSFGNPPVGNSFDGKLLKLDLDVDRSIYTSYDAAPTPVAALKMAAFMAAPQVTSVVLDDYLLDGTAMAKLKPVQMLADAHVDLKDGRTVLSFDGTGDQVNLGKLMQFQNSDKLAIQVDFQRDAGGDRDGTLVSNAGQFQLDVMNDGFRLRVATTDEGMKTYEIDKLGLTSANWHEAAVIVDAAADRLQVFLNDRLVFQDDHTHLAMTNPAGGSSGWRLGAGFDGHLADLRIDDDIGHQLATGGVVAFA